MRLRQPLRKGSGPLNRPSRPSHAARRVLPRLLRGGFRQLTLLLALLSLVLAPSSGTFALAQGQTPEEKAAQLLEQLTPQERVGQLFLVTFDGADAGAGTAIHDLIDRYHIGGVALRAENDNFTADESTLQSLLSLTRQLQLNSWNSSRTPRTSTDGETFTPQFIPLWIAISQEGDGFPYSEILDGVTPLPNEMALGATWDPALAERVGEVLGSELTSLGVNLLLGPSLDVLETPHTESTTDLGVRTFGGDPYWVAEMGSAFVRGVHSGSNNRLAVVAKHFPGHGAADRLPEEEVATVRKSLSELQDFDLVPFFAVTGEAASDGEQVEGLLASHIRYQGFQGNIRDTTRPVTMDPAAFSELLGLKAISAWRDRAGIMVSDDLGSQAVRSYYTLNNQSFDTRRVAQSAFQAGNDLLYIADFTTGEEGSDAFTEASRALDFFTQKYREDPFFAQRVNESVLRLLTQKFRLYDTFAFPTVITNPGGLENIGRSSELTLEVAQRSATLISPSLEELSNTIPDPPNQNDHMVFITDELRARQCSSCGEQTVFAVNALEDVVVRRYGPDAAGVITPGSLSSYAIDDLVALLEAGPGDPSSVEGLTQIEADLERANWIIFSMLDNSTEAPSYQALKAFLTERPDLFQQKRVIVFAFGAPYYLDATNISKLAAYYGLYSKAPQFIDVAAYLLFRELAPDGSLPVTVPGVYDLNQALFPDPSQVIQLFLDTNAAAEQLLTATPTLPSFGLGDIIAVRTGVIVDHNGNPVTDGTPVEFLMTVGGEAAGSRQVETTVDGVARTTFQVTSSGVIEIRASSEPANQSNVLRFDIQTGEAEIILMPSATPSPTETPTPTATVTPGSQSGAAQPPAEPPDRLSFGDWLVALLVSIGVSLGSYRLVSMLGNIRWGVRGALLALVGGLSGYSYLALELPGSQRIAEGSITRGAFLITLGGALLGLALAWLWRTAATHMPELPARESPPPPKASRRHR